MAEGVNFDDSRYFINRELSWLDFNERILGEARDKKNKLFERLKFLSITASNLDEFYMVRVASLKDMIHAGYEKKDISGMKPEEQLKAINEKVHQFVDKQYSTYNRSLIPALSSSGLVSVLSFPELNKEQKEYVERFFDEEIYPVLTPMAVDSSRPFPLIRNKTLNIAALTKKKNSKKDEVEFVTVQVPSVLSRIVMLPLSGEKMNVILLEEIIKNFISKLFLNYDVICSYSYRIMGISRPAQ